jgi:hypothetical protein
MTILYTINCLLNKEKAVKLKALAWFLCLTSNTYMLSISQSHSIYVSRQLSYNPILENALLYAKKNKRNVPNINNQTATEVDAYGPLVLKESSVKNSSTRIADSVHEKKSCGACFTCWSTIHHDWDYLFSVRPLYSQTTGNSLRQYLSINNAKCSFDVKQNGLGSIDPLWLNVSAYPNSYQSVIELHPSIKTGGGVLFFQAQLPCNLSLSVDTALIYRSNSVHLVEKDILYTGTSRYTTVATALASSDYCFGKVCGSQGTTGLDDIQVKLLYGLRDTACYYWDVYGLLGLPTGKGSKGHYMFEPLVGSKHVQLGFGSTALWQAYESDCGVVSLQGEFKYRYGFKATEWRSFDLTCNGQWSRYLGVVDRAKPTAIMPAINFLTFKSQVTPRSSLDVYLAATYVYKQWHAELGYDFWYRSAERVHPKYESALSRDVGIADLVGIANGNPQTASTARISQGITYGLNQAVSDASFVPLTLSDIRCSSGAAPQSASNSVYASLGYYVDWKKHPMEFGVSMSYEAGTNAYTANTVSGWLSFDMYL